MKYESMASGIICRRAHPWDNKYKERNISRRLSITTVICVGYDLPSRKGFLNHLLFMVDLKLYGKNEKQLDTFINTIRVFSSDIAMEFGISKWSWKVERYPSVKGLEEGDGYKYLGILEADDLKHAHMKEAISKEYLRRIRKILKSNLNGGECNQCKGSLNNTLWCRDYQVDQRRTQEAG